RQPIRGRSHPPRQPESVGKRWSASLRSCDPIRLGSGALARWEATSPSGSAAHGDPIAHHGSYKVLHLLLAETVEAKREVVVHLIVDGTGDDDVTGLSKFLQTRRDIDAVPVNVGPVHHHVA